MMKKFLLGVVLCLAIATLSMTSVVAFASDVDLNRFDKSSDLETEWSSGLSSFASQTVTNYTFSEGSKHDNSNTSAPHAFMFGVDGGYCVANTPFANIGENVAIDWYFNMKGCGNGAENGTINFAVVQSNAGVSAITSDTPVISLGATVTATGKAVENATIGVSTHETFNSMASIYNFNDWGSNTQLKVRFTPCQNKIEFMKLKTGIDASFVTVATVNNIVIPTTNA